MISIIIPLYNKEPIIERSLRSVLSQDYDDFEVIVVNDGSTDKSADIVRSINDPRIRLIEQENGGPSNARNTGIRAAKGDWYYLIDADDEMLPCALTHLKNIASLHSEADMILGETIISRNGKQTLCKVYDDNLVDSMFNAHFYGKTYQCSGTTLYKKQTTSEFLFNECIRRYEDLERLFRLYRFAKVFTTHKPVSIINVAFASASHGRKDIKEDFLGHLDFKGKSFWEKMCLYQLFIGERPHYPEQCKSLYPSLYKRWDLYFIYQLLSRTKKIWA